jgi:hypothetical protein
MALSAMSHPSEPALPYSQLMAGRTGTSGLAFDLGNWFESHELRVRKNLDRYFSGNPGDLFTGRHFERYSDQGADNSFEPSDVLAVRTLSVDVPVESAAELLLTRGEWFSEYLADVPVERDMWDVERDVFADESAASLTHARLRTLDGVDWVTAGKLLASKRPRLLPVYDNLVKSLLNRHGGPFWLPLYDQLSDPQRRSKIDIACSTAPEHVSLLRRIDVALWMHVKHPSAEVAD